MMLDSELEGMRSTQLSIMVEEAVIYRHTRARDSMGGFTNSYQAAGTTPCKFTRPEGHAEIVRGTRIDEGGRLGDTGVLVPVEVRLKVGDRLLINGIMYDVLIADDDRTFATANEYYLGRVAA